MTTQCRIDQVNIITVVNIWWSGHTCRLSYAHLRFRDLTAQCCFWPSGSSRVPWKTQPKCPDVHKGGKRKSRHQCINLSEVLCRVYGRLISLGFCWTMRNPQSCLPCGQRNNVLGIFLFPSQPSISLSLSRHPRGNFPRLDLHAMRSEVKQRYVGAAPCFTALPARPTKIFCS